MSAARPLFSEFNGFLSKNGMRSINFQEVEEGGEQEQKIWEKGGGERRVELTHTRCLAENN